jgi:hypothetical protein
MILSPTPFQEPNRLWHASDLPSQFLLQLRSFTSNDQSGKQRMSANVRYYPRTFLNGRMETEYLHQDRNETETF